MHWLLLRWLLVRFLLRRQLLMVGPTLQRLVVQLVVVVVVLLLWELLVVLLLMRPMVGLAEVLVLLRWGWQRLLVRERQG